MLGKFFFMLSKDIYITKNLLEKLIINKYAILKWNINY